MPKVSERSPERPRIFLFKGEPKTAKSTASASFPDPIYIFDLDYRIGWLGECPWLLGKDIEYDTYDDWGRVTRKLDDLITRCDFKTVVMSSLTSLSRATINTLLRNRGDSNANTRSKGKEEQLRIGGIPIMGIAEYNGESSGLNSILTQLRMLHNTWRCNVILECHVVQGDVPQLDGSTKQFRRIVTGGNKVAAEVPVYFDEIYHFYCSSDINGGANKYIANTRSSGLDFAGTTIQELPNTIDHTNENFYKIWSSYLGQTQSNTSVVLPDINER